MQQLISEILFLGQRFNKKSIIDILLVACIIYVFLRFVRGTQANTLIRGTIIIMVVLGLLFVLTDLPAFSWLIGSLVPILLIVVPVVFSPEIRRAFERMGRVQSLHDLFFAPVPYAEEMNSVIKSVVVACSRLAERNHGALIVMQRSDDLQKYIQTGVEMDAIVSPETLLQIFYPNTPLHDGAVIISKGRITAAACVMPLSSRNVLDKSPERHMGLRHRAALGISETNDSVTVVVSEESGSISVAYEGKIKRGISADQLCILLTDLYSIPQPVSFQKRLKDFFVYIWEKIVKANKE
ncbi:diadenylate cyclase CdaA [Flexilinea flocculi]|jgi:diadenylate cyclase|uniref:Diadenylate cyclase n=1 Tax=Flexilinea flocculi TaxID=1678840 RepID=A0A0S7BSK1_9CHLR|nr:diadenylate cyclase CdaA [Flexilinea flocculi]NMB93607.1 TIGR00159 family protein [Flexilinea flocculi]GAP40718.1 TIGR00159 family protein [Flexilinea flocculi]